MCVGWDTLWKKLVKMDFTRYLLESTKVTTELTGRKKVETELEPLFPLYVSDMITSDTCILKSWSYLGIPLFCWLWTLHLQGAGHEAVGDQVECDAIQERCLGALWR